MNSLRWYYPPVLHRQISLPFGNDPGGASDVEAPRCEKLLAGFRLRGMRPEASRDRRGTPRGLACQGRVRLVPLQDWAAQPAPGLRPPCLSFAKRGLLILEGLWRADRPWRRKGRRPVGSPVGFRKGITLLKVERRHSMRPSPA